ncbi:MAG: GNAT family N-acetyltransferase [Pseudomonadota bacterium]
MIRKAQANDHARVVRLYRDVAAVPDGIARTPGEVNDAYVSGFMHRAEADGIELVFEQDGRIVGEIHASRVGIAALAHVLTDLTIAVCPQVQGKGVGRRLFRALLDEVSVNMPHITRIELFARDSNVRARALYASLGFVEEGRLRARVNNAKGEAETDTIMGWLRPSP